MDSNYHSHCLFCDGRASMETFIKFAIAKGLKNYGISSHAPVPFPNKWSMKKEDLDEYRQEFFRLQKKYQSKINIYLGLEVDYIPNTTSVNDPNIKKHQWDYLIGSIHHLGQYENGEYWNIDGDLNLFKKGLNEIFSGNIFNATKTFYHHTNEMIEEGGFDIIGHLDKIALNGRLMQDFNLLDKWYENLIMETFELIASKNIIIEINTKSFYNKKIIFPDIRYFKKIKQLNIPVMVNSDCHYPDKITDGFKETYLLLREAGFKTTRELRSNQWTDVAIQ